MRQTVMQQQRLVEVGSGSGQERKLKRKRWKRKQLEAGWAGKQEAAIFISPAVAPPTVSRPARRKLPVPNAMAVNAINP